MLWPESRLDFPGVDGIGRHILNLVRNVQLVQKAHNGGRPGTAGFSVEGYFHINRASTQNFAVLGVFPNASVFRQRQKLATSGKVLFEIAQQAGGNHLAFLFADSTATHALMFRLDHHGYSLGLQNPLQIRRDLLGQTFLYLEPRAYISSNRASFDSPTILLFGR